MENFSKLGDNIYSVSGSDIYVHMFFSSEITDAANNVKLTQKANMPNEDIVTFAVEAADGGSVKAGATLRLRKPDWLAGTAEIKVNDKAAELKEENGYYVVEVKAGDKISYQTPMEVQVYDMPDKPNMVAFKYGPVVLSTALGTDNIERSAANGILVRVGVKDENAKTTIYVSNKYKNIEDWKEDIAENLVRIEDSEDGKVQFKLANTDSPELIYTPHYMRYKETYGLYMSLEVADSEEAQQHILEEKEKLREFEMSLDYLYNFDNNNSEFAKNLQASSNSEVATYSGRQLRHAPGGGWFSYDLKIDPEAETNYLNCTFYSGDRTRTFDILVNDEVLTSQPFKDAPQNNEFYVQTFEIPQDMIDSAVDGKITVKFSSTNNSYVGGLFGISTSASADYSTDATMKGLSFNKGILSPEFSDEETSYVLKLPKTADSVEMTAVPNVESGLIYVEDILINDAIPRQIDIKEDGQVINITSKAQDHETAKEYKVTIQYVDVDKAELDKAIKAAVPVADKEKYAEKSWAAYEKALNAAKNVFEDEKADQKAVDAAVKSLKEAQEALKVKLPYVDVAENAWYYDTVAYNYAEKTMTGKDATHFAPEETLVRAQFAAVLHKMNEEPEMDYKAVFSDVAAGDWFKNAVLWAADAKIVTGYTGTDLFGANDAVTRAQMATMMYRYAKDYKGYNVKADGDYSSFPDAGDVQEFAVDAMKWAVAEGIITGKTINGQLLLDPQGSANRAECATIIQRFMEKYEK